jgi:glycerol-3-phosphate dehydrogenase (NAD(P)+)
MIAILGAGAMGSALAVHWARRHAEVVLLATEHDTAALEAWNGHLPHPALGIPMPREVRCLPPEEWGPVLAEADQVTVCVSTPGLQPTIRVAALWARPDAVWVIATKGWQAGSLQSPSEVAASVLGEGAPVVALAGPELAAEIVVAAPTAVVAAAADVDLAERVAGSLRSGMLAVAVTDDVAGVETASAFKNVVAIAVGICEGLSDRLGQSVLVHSFANARAAVFAQGLVDMARLAEAKGGRTATVLGLAGAGDVFVTALGGRNGRFGRLLGAGQTPEQALRAIGSTVEGVANTTAALGLASRFSLELPTAAAVDMALRQGLLGDEGLVALRELFATAVTDHHRIQASSSRP